MSYKDEWLEGYRKHKAEWEKYTKSMGRTVELGVHNFDGSDDTCTKCGVASIDVNRGSASWVCMAKHMECCGKQGVEKWDFNRSMWICSECKVPRSTDYNYSGWDTSKKIDANNEIFKPKRVDPHKCDCTIQTLMAKGCQCSGT